MEINNYILLEGIICFFFTIALLFYYIRKNANPIVIIISIIAWFLNFYMIILLPYDIFISNTKEENEPQKNEKSFILIKIIYLIIYWPTFLNSWIFIPLLRKYETSGQLTQKEKLIYSIKKNLINYGITILILFILFIWAKLKLREETINYFFKNMFNFSYLYGLAYLFIFLSYGIVRLPKNIYDKLNTNKTIIQMEIEAKYLKEKFDKIRKEFIKEIYRLKDLIDYINNRKELDSHRDSSDEGHNNIEYEKDKKNNKNGGYNDIEKYLFFLKNKFDTIKSKEKILEIKIESAYIFNDEDRIRDIKGIRELNNNLMSNELDILRLKCQIDQVYNQWCLLNSIILKGKKYQSLMKEDKENENSITLMLKNEFKPMKNISAIKIMFYKKIRPIFLIFAIIIFSSIGIITLFSEISFALPWNISIFGFLVSRASNVLYLHIVVTIPILLLLYMTIYALFKFKITGFYGMFPNKQTDSVSLLYFTSNFCDIIFPLCLNILLMINKGDNENKKTILENYFGININNAIFANFSKYIPLLLIIFVIISEILNCLGMNIFSGFSSKGQLDIQEGHEYLLKMNKSKNEE